MQPKVVIDNLVFRRIMHWINKSNHEVSGLGIISREGDDILRVTHAMLLPQVNGPTHTDIEPEDAAKLLYQCKDLPGDLRFWWHSHVNMDVFWSGTDMDTIKKIGQGGWFLSTVFNKRREMLSSFYSIDGLRTPFGAYPLFLDKLETTVEAFSEPDAAQWDAEYTENVKDKPTYFRGHTWINRATELLPKHAGQLGARDGLVALPDKRPAGVTKSDWRALKKERKLLDKHFALPETKVLSLAEKYPLPEVTDVYGFTRDERMLLSKEGWDDKDIDALFEEDVAPVDMLTLAMLDMKPNELLDLISNGWEIKEIILHFSKGNQDDTPVMDRANGGKYDQHV